MDDDEIWDSMIVLELQSMSVLDDAWSVKTLRIQKLEIKVSKKLLCRISREIVENNKRQ